MELTLLHGAKKYSLVVFGSDTTAPCVSDLQSSAEQETGVPNCNQRLIYKGKTLSDGSKTLEEMGLSNGTKVMMIGSKVDENPELTRELQRLEKEVSKDEARAESLGKDVDGLSSGFVPTEHVTSRRRELERTLRQQAEAALRRLEELDAVCVTQAARPRRKALVARTQTVLERLDASLDKVCRQTSSDS